MVLLNFHAKNFFEFNDLYIDFTYPKKIVHSTIGEEHLDGYPNFRYKKLVILMGANATGKTTLGKMLMSILNFIVKREYFGLVENINNKKHPAEFLIDIAINGILYRIESKIGAAKNGEYNSSSISVCVRSEAINTDDSYESCIGRLLEQKQKWNTNYIQELEKVGPLSWMFKYPGQDKNAIKSATMVNEQRFIKILSATLKAIDPKIKKVERDDKYEDTYSIKFSNRTVMLKDGMLLDGEISSGTLESIGVAHMIAGIKSGAYKFFYCDEKFSHIHTEVEKAFISLMVSSLGKNHQLIVTTHNIDVLDMNYPKHSFAFLKRENDNSVSVVYASEYIKKNTVSLKHAIENDLFGTSPDVMDIYRLESL